MPRRIGKVTVLAELGAGAGSRVYHVLRKSDSYEYALKVVSIRSSNDLKYLEQARHEFRIGRLLDHPNLVRVRAFEIERGWLSGPRCCKLLVEYAPGRTLHELPLPSMAELLQIFEQVADALAHMHERGIIHADLKPKNLIYCSDNGVKVIDYGLAWVKGEPKGRLQGTPQYMAPETAAHKLINERTDVFNFGATMYRLLTRGTLPRMAPGLIPDRKTYDSRIKSVERLNASAPSELCELIHSCLSYLPDDRPEDMNEVRSILSQLAHT
jgi:eukaryotic-like serine/threonine-protein kinase